MLPTHHLEYCALTLLLLYKFYFYLLLSHFITRLLLKIYRKKGGNTRNLLIWGNYDSVVEGERWQVKRIEVKPAASLSLQMHHHRTEHWIVVTGTAEVEIDSEKFIIGENKSIYIPLGSSHRLSNPGKIPLILIEVQSGSYLKEDDIVRIDDMYGRKNT